jgi:hypothetical protein
MGVGGTDVWVGRGGYVAVGMDVGSTVGEGVSMSVSGVETAVSVRITSSVWAIAVKVPSGPWGVGAEISARVGKLHAAALKSKITINPNKGYFLSIAFNSLMSTESYHARPAHQQVLQKIDDSQSE